jgi:hypothetical protein
MRQLERIQDKVEGIWSYTELELSDYSAIGLQKHLSIISEIVNDVLDDIENLNTCTVCQTEVCDTCLDDMAKQV